MHQMAPCTKVIYQPHFMSFCCQLWSNLPSVNRPSGGKIYTNMVRLFSPNFLTEIFLAFISQHLFKKYLQVNKKNLSQLTPFVAEKTESQAPRPCQSKTKLPPQLLRLVKRLPRDFLKKPKADRPNNTR